MTCRVEMKCVLISVRHRAQGHSECYYGRVLVRFQGCPIRLYRSGTQEAFQQVNCDGATREAMYPGFGLIVG